MKKDNVKLNDDVKLSTKAKKMLGLCNEYSYVLNLLTASMAQHLGEQLNKEDIKIANRLNRVKKQMNKFVEE